MYLLIYITKLHKTHHYLFLQGAERKINEEETPRHFYTSWTRGPV